MPLLRPWAWSPVPSMPVPSGGWPQLGALGRRVRPRPPQDGGVSARLAPSVPSAGRFILGFHPRARPPLCLLEPRLWDPQSGRRVDSHSCHRATAGAWCLHSPTAPSGFPWLPPPLPLPDGNRNGWWGESLEPGSNALTTPRVGLGAWGSVLTQQCPHSSGWFHSFQREGDRYPRSTMEYRDSDPGPHAPL